MKIEGQIVDVIHKKIFPGRVVLNDKKIESVEKFPEAPMRFILPGFIDSHVHIESSMVLPSRFAEVAVSHGTLATVSDPHEIANVLGVEGIDYMINDGNKVPFRFYFGAPSCVPATSFDYSGFEIGVEEIRTLLSRDDIYYLSEMMNFPGVILRREDVIKKLELVREFNKPVDGHAPGLRGEDLKAYRKEGITTDHESFSLGEAREKIANGMLIQIREGSAALNFNALHPLIDEFPGKVMFCTDDCHPNDLIKGHINNIVKKSLEKGHELFNVLTAASVTPKRHYNLDIGLLQPGDSADFIVVDNLDDFSVQEAWIGGNKIYDSGIICWKRPESRAVNNFISRKIVKKDIEIKTESTENTIKVIGVLDGELITRSFTGKVFSKNGKIQSDTHNDILKIVVVNRYSDRKPAVGFVKGFGLNKGAIGGSIAHDSHNLIAVGVADEDILQALNHLMATKGGIVSINEGHVTDLPLPVAGLMSMDTVHEVANTYELLDKKAHESGCKLKAPFMTLAFMSLLVIPELKLGDKGLFDVTKFEYTSLFES